MTKQFEISKHLAEWLGYKVVGVSEPQYQNTEPMVVVQAGECRKEIFNPFANTVDGRAQLAECLLKAITGSTKVSTEEAVVKMLSNIEASFTTPNIPYTPKKPSDICVDAKAAMADTPISPTTC